MEGGGRGGPQPRAPCGTGAPPLHSPPGARLHPNAELCSGWLRSLPVPLGLLMVAGATVPSAPRRIIPHSGPARGSSPCCARCEAATRNPYLFCTRTSACSAFRAFHILPGPPAHLPSVLPGIREPCYVRPLPRMGLDCYFFHLRCHSPSPHFLENSSSSFKIQSTFTPLRSRL